MKSAFVALGAQRNVIFSGNELRHQRRIRTGAVRRGNYHLTTYGTTMIAEPLLSDPINKIKPINTINPIDPINTQASDIDERYAQRHPLQIAVSLRSLVARGDFLTVEFNHTQTVTQLLDVDSRRARFVFDVSGTLGRDAALPNADSLMFRSQPSGIYTEFGTGRAARTIFEGRPAFEAPFPTLLYHVQRREYHRVETPTSDPFIATGCDEAGEAFQLEVHDLSLGGVALRSISTRLASLERGTFWRDVTLQMGGYGTVTLDLEIVSPRLMLTPS